MNDPSKCPTLIELLQWRAAELSNETLYIFLADGELEELRLSYRQLDQRARAIACKLQSSGPPGARALLLFQPGLDFIAAFFGCLYAGVIAIPAYPPRNPRNVPRIQTIAADAEASFCLTSSGVLARARELFGIVPGLEQMLWLATDEIADNLPPEWKIASAHPETLAYLQYTSGSTSAPKGVMVSHGNLIHNLSFLCGGRGHTKIVSWLPFFHDMGLIYGILQALYGGFPSILMAPASFLQRPYRWLHALSRYQASTTIAPNFAYELCAQKISDEEKRTLDLSHWTMALNAAEPVRLETLERFAAAFAGCGFRPDYLKPAYGLAEATLGVSIYAKPQRYCVKIVDKAEFERHRIVDSSPGTKPVCRLIGCGQGAADQKVAIVNPDTLRRCAPGSVGEIWLSSPSIAKGYWRKPRETRETFQALIADTGEGPFLRTGDLGFFEDNELFITGRVKDLIIIRGGNHYPQDIELTAQKSHRALQPDAGAAFSVEIEGEERLVVAQELIRHHKADLSEVATCLREAVAEVHGIQVYAMLLVKPHSVPKTSSGKIQRRSAREMFLTGQFEVEWEWRAETAKETEPPMVQTAPVTDASRIAEEKALESWLISRLSATLKIPPSEIGLRQSFSRFGLDSLGAVSLTGELQEKLGRALPSSLLFDFPTIESVVKHLAGEIAANFPVEKNERNLSTEPIAVIGMACRFPGANNPGEFWKILHEGIDAISVTPQNRWDVDALYHSTPGTPGKTNTKWGGFLQNIDQFAADFFEISPREAAQMDPQQRLLLEVTWEALENAGIPPAQIAGTKTGVFVGISSFDYSLLQFRDTQSIDAYAGTGLAHSIAANRISYFLDLRGPSVAVDTACSSSLVAVHEACESLRQRESDTSLAGGVNVMATPELTIALSQARMMASDGRCKTFDSRADGYVRGEGCGMIVLKRLSDALRDGNPIFALIRGSAINQDGRSNGLTAPNGPAQEAVIRAALAHAGVSPQEIGCVECHGTGTALGDPQEVEALNHVLGSGGSESHKCWLGSVKTNIGHLEAAAGIAGLIKAVLSIRHRLLPPTLHFKKINPHIHLEQTPFVISTGIEPWKSSGRRLAGVSSFGFGGTNAHVILEEAPESKPTENQIDRPLNLLTLSAKNADALQESARAMTAFLSEANSSMLADICFTANAGRTHFDRRLAVIANSNGEAAESIGAFLSGKTNEATFRGDVAGGSQPRIAFLFTGQGSQHVEMGKILYETQPTFRKALDQCDEILRPCLSESLLSVLYPRTGKASPLNETAYAQPALFSIEYALAALWQSWGIVPEAVLGHSVGEYTAACVAGIFELEAGLKLIAKRARLMDALPRSGQMAMVFASAKVVEKEIRDYTADISIAAINGPELTVLSGKTDALRKVLSRFAERRIKNQLLRVSHAFHSPLMEPILKEFQSASESVSFRKPQIPFISNLTGDWLPSDSTTNAEYWARHIREPVQFSRGITTLFTKGCTHFLECGPNPTLLALAKRCASGKSNPNDPIAWLPSLNEGCDDWRSILASLAQLYVAGAPVDWKGFERGYSRTIVSLPTYRFQRESYWVGGNENGPQESGSKESSDPAWSKIISAGKVRAGAGFSDSSFAVESEKFGLLNKLSSGYLVRGLKKLDVISPTGKILPDKIYESRIHPRHRKAVAAWLKNLSPETVEEAASLTDLWDKIGRAWKGEIYFPQLVRHCGQHLPELLTGEIDPLTLIFEKGSSDTMEKIYSASALARYCNGILQDVAGAIIASSGRNRKIRILEIGAGTGATTRFLLPLLPAERTEYIFTDLGSVFLQTAREKFSDFPFVQYKLLNAETDPSEQGFEFLGFDIVVAANVLHATRRLNDTLKNVASLVAPGGYLLLWEATQQQAWMDAAFSLIEGWQRFEDFDLRPDQPLLSPKVWTDVLSRHFNRVAVFPEAGTSGAGFGQSVILARSALQTNLSPHTTPREVALARSDDWKIKDILYETKWERVERGSDSTDKEIEANRGTWLIFSDETGLGKNLSRLLKARGDNCVLCHVGTAFRKLDRQNFQIDPTRTEDASRIFEEAQPFLPEKNFCGIIYLWGLALVGELSHASIEKAQLIGCEMVARVIQILATRNSQATVSPRVWLVTRGAQPVHGNNSDDSAVAQSLIWGFGRSLAVEQPQWWGGLIDLENVPNKNEARLLLECLENNGREDQLALRNGELYGCRLAPRKVPIAERRSWQVSIDGTYLITGGLGGIGLKVAHWLARKGARRLLLIGRQALPPRASWKHLLKTETPVAQKIKAFLELEALGANVQIEAVDIGNESDVESFFQKFEEESRPPIRALFHAAGVIEDSSLSVLNEELLSRVLRPKVLGTHLLVKHLPSASLQNIVFFSSASALVGSRSSAAYTAGNAFLDAYAGLLRKQGRSAVSVGWGPWEQVGMAGREDRAGRLSAQGVLPIATETALEALEFALTEAEPRMAVMSVDWVRFFEANVRSSACNFFTLCDSSKKDQRSKSVPSGTRSDTPPPKQADGKEQKNTSVSELVKKILAEVLKSEPSRLEIQRRLSSLGLDSIMAVQVKHEIELEFGISISIQDVAQSTIAELVKKIVEKRPAQASAEGNAEKS